MTAWKAKWLVDGRPASPISSSSSSDDEDMSDVCGTCFTLQTTSMCGGCSATNCFSLTCARPCAACDVDMCNACSVKFDQICVHCTGAFQTRNMGEYLRRLPWSDINSDTQFQHLLDIITEHMGIDPEYDLRGEDGLEVRVPLAPLPKKADCDQRTLDVFFRPALFLIPHNAPPIDFVATPQNRLSLPVRERTDGAVVLRVHEDGTFDTDGYASDHSSSYDGGGDSESIADEGDL